MALTYLLLLAFAILPHISFSHVVTAKHPTDDDVASALAAYSHHGPGSSGAILSNYEDPSSPTAFRIGLGSSVTTQLSTSGRVGFSQELCITGSDCLGSRFCAQILDGSVSVCEVSTAENPCICLPLQASDFFCSCLDPCPAGDKCILASNGNGNCIFEDANAQPFPCGPDAGGFSGEVCSSTEGCAVGRVCRSESDPERDCSVGLCFCIPSAENMVCSCAEPSCLPGDICGISPTSGNSVCVSLARNFPPLRCDSTRAPTPSPSSAPSTPSSQPNPSVSSVPVPGTTTLPVPPGAGTSSASPSPPPTEEVCIDVRRLSSFKRNELVYEKDPVSRVLCDRSGSCATPGHIVRYKGLAMMMKSYCEMVGCEKAVMEVNSPRYRRGVRVGSKTDELHFTAFAARYGTKAEEGLMAVAVRIGL